GYLEGVVDQVVYTNEENGYTVCVLDCLGEPVTLVGTMPFLGEGETIKVYGSWTVHPTFGRQFKVETFEKRLPDSVEAIYRYLSSGALKGVGPVLAERLIHAYGEETLDVIEHHHRWLCDVKGISPKKADELHEAFAQQFGLRSVMLAFGEFFGPALSVRIFKHFGTAAVDLVKQNPYRLCTEVDGIGFQRADQFARAQGIAPDAEERLQAGIRFVVDSAAFQNGHCRLPEEQLRSLAAKTLGVPGEAVQRTLASLSIDKILIRTEEEGQVYYASQELYTAEHYIASKLSLLASEKRPLLPAGVEERIAGLEREGGITYAPEQRQAITYAVTEGLTIVTGGPGTGKTTVIKAILQLFDDLKLDCLLAAPTGRAAKRMSEASGKEAKTIHRLLETGFTEEHKTRFARGEDNPLACKALIIDEMSMVDTLLLEALLRAVRPGTYLIFIGDVDQLPSVGPGNCLADLISSDRFPVVRLHHIFRQAEQSLITTNAHRINRGEMPVLSVRDSDFFFLERHGANALKETLLQLCALRLPRRYNVDPLEDIQIICWTRKGPLGTAELNAALQETLNPPGFGKREKKVGSRCFREGDKVMQIRNNYDLLWTRTDETGNQTDGAGIFNGDIGRVRRINPQGETLLIDFDDRVCEYDFSLLEDLELAYAITTHKSQGSEYRFVLIPAFEAAYPLMTRNLLYTAVTRAREMVCIVGEQQVLSVMVSNDRKPMRYTALPGILRRV
ncbi:MAG: ATP-dependent RecD-like DNA helicase, partial [Oscillospiraceae bacterium]|nr:ATP-dependent RecD-like DNA helicase [Oscillospiraceae bacterium]